MGDNLCGTANPTRYTYSQRFLGQKKTSGRARHSDWWHVELAVEASRRSRGMHGFHEILCFHSSRIGVSRASSHDGGLR